MLFVLLILAILLLTVFSVIYWTLHNGIGPTPTSAKVRHNLMALLPDEVEGTIYELGSGWGTLAFPLAKRYPNHTVIAYENSPIPYWFSQLRLWLQPQPNLRFEKKDFYEADLSDAGLIVCYLFPKAMARLEIKLMKERGSHVILLTHTFALPHERAERTLYCKDLYTTPIYFYQLRKKQPL